jgi:hypothetical protein
MFFLTVKDVFMVPVDKLLNVEMSGGDLVVILTSGDRTCFKFKGLTMADVKVINFAHNFAY